jgi:hypothetical protein
VVSIVSMNVHWILSGDVFASACSTSYLLEYVSYSWATFHKRMLIPYVVPRKHNTSYLTLHLQCRMMKSKLPSKGW